MNNETVAKEQTVTVTWKCLIPKVSLRNECVEIEVDFDIPTSIRLSKPENKKGLTGKTVCTVTRQYPVSGVVSDTFSKIENGEIETKDKNIGCWYTDNEGEKHGLPWISDFPKKFQAFVSKINQDFSSISDNLIGILRWRFNFDGPHRSGGRWDFKWKMTGDLLRPFPNDFSASVRLGDSFLFDDEKKANIEDLFANDDFEPVYHSLFREAWHIRHSNPRSSLIIGISAIEVAVKEVIVSKVPDSEWLVFKAPTPRIVAMIKNYIPKLPGLPTIDGSVPELSKAERSKIQEAVEARNSLAHRGQFSTGSEGDSLRSVLEQYLIAIKRFIWLADFYQGFPWALDHINDDYGQGSYKKPIEVNIKEDETIEEALERLADDK